jgi:tetratricopeptide (TPR) repeat protein
MSKVFLCYSRKDKDYVNELYRWLARDGDDKFEEEYPWICRDLGGAVTEKYADELLIGHSKEVAATFKISWDLATSTAKAVLQSISFLGPEPVPRRLLREIIDIPSESVIEVPLDDAISELASQLSLVELDEDNDPWVHRLISALVRDTTDAPGNLAEIVCKAVVEEMARVADESDTLSYGQLEKILPHAELLISSEAIKTEQAIDLANYLCMYYWRWERFCLAEKHGRKAVEISESHFKPGHPRIATSRSNLGEVLRNIGALKEARDLLRMALESDEKSFEPGHPRIALRQSVLALVFQDLGELKEARDLLRMALESNEKSFEPGHPKIAIRQSNLASVLQDLGELKEARDLLRMALESDEKSFEPGHPGIALSQANLALVLQDLAELKEARDLLRMALESDEKSFEPGHPRIAISQANLGEVLKNMGELKEARDLLRKALESDEKSFEPGHPIVALRQSVLALVLQDLGELEAARDLAGRAYRSFLNKFGAEHSYTKTAKRNWETF